MIAPVHRAATGFLRGALVAVVAQVAAVPLAAGVGSIPFLAPLAPLIRILVPLAGFALAGAVGGEALGAGRLGAPAMAAGGLVEGLVLTMTSPNLSGLTGHENPAVVLAYATGTFAAAFGLGGGLGGAVLRRGIAVRATAAFAAAGALGGCAGILPFLFARIGPDAWGGLGLQFLWLAASIGSIAVPLSLGGALTARAIHGGRGG